MLNAQRMTDEGRGKMDARLAGERLKEQGQEGKAHNSTYNKQPTTHNLQQTK